MKTVYGLRNPRRKKPPSRGWARPWHRRAGSRRPGAGSRRPEAGPREIEGGAPGAGGGAFSESSQDLSVRALDGTRSLTLTGPGGGKPTTAPALADEARRRQVVTNLVGNAVAHTPAGTPVRIGVGTTDADAALEVADQGPA